MFIHATFTCYFSCKSKEKGFYLCGHIMRQTDDRQKKRYTSGGPWAAKLGLQNKEDCKIKLETFQGNFCPALDEMVLEEKRKNGQMTYKNIY